MKFVRLNTLLQTILSRNSSITNSKVAISLSFYSTTTTRTRATTPSRERYIKSRINPLAELHHRISRARDNDASITPILDHWIEEGGSVDRDDLLFMIRKLRFYRRFSHALQMSMWMSEKRYFMLTSGDVAIRLDLITKVHGIEQAENFFNNIPKQLRGLEVYGALVNCYAYAKSVEKAEEVMQKMRDLGLAMTSLSYNAMLNLYYTIGDIEKLGNLICEMEDKGIRYDSFTYGTILAAYAAVPDVDGVQKTVTKMETDPYVVLNWSTYGVAANGYTKVGLFDKALEMLKKAEGLVTKKERNTAYNFLLTQYASIEKKEEVLRLWDIYKKEKVFNKGYLAMLSSLLKFDDLESAENLFEEWESQSSNYDIQIPNLLVSYYTKNGLLENAETIVNRVISKGITPNPWTWSFMAAGYLLNDQTPTAVEMMKRAISLKASNSRWEPRSEDLAAILSYLGGENLEEAKSFVKLLRDNNVISLNGQQRLLDHMKQRNSNLKGTSSVVDDCLVEVMTWNGSFVGADDDNHEPECK